MSKDETRKKKINYIKRSQKNKGEKKTLIRGIQIFNQRVSLNWKTALIKEKKIQRNESQTKKNKTI
jgi:hypothetical protein